MFTHSSEWYTTSIPFVDDKILLSFFSFQSMSLLVTTVLIVGSVNYWLFILVVPVSVIFMFARNYFMQTTHDVERIELICKYSVPWWQYIAWKQQNQILQQLLLYFQRLTYNSVIKWLWITNCVISWYNIKISINFKISSKLSWYNIKISIYFKISSKLN